MNVNWGSVPDWVAGVSTSGTLIAATALLIVDRRNREIIEADNFRATLDLEGNDYAVPSNLVMTICNFGRTTFWDVAVYRCAYVVPAGSSEGRLKWYRAQLEYVDAHTTYEWLVEKSVTLGTGRGPHHRSFETFVHRGIRYARYRRQPLKRVSHWRNRREFQHHVAEFETHSDLTLLEYHGTRARRTT